MEHSDDCTSIMEHSHVLAHLLNADTISLKADKPLTIMDIKRRMTTIRTAPADSLPPDVHVLTYPAATTFPSDRAPAPAHVYVIFNVRERAKGDPSWAEAFAAYAEACDAQGIKHALPHLSFANDECLRVAKRPLSAACEDGNLAVVQAHIDAGVDWSLFGCLNNYTTPLTTSCFAGHTDIVNALVTSRASVQERDCYGNTPLLAACIHGHCGVVNALLDTKASPDHRTEGDTWTFVSDSTPLTEASTRGFLNVVQALLVAGADPNGRNYKGYTPLYVSSKYGHVAIVEALVAAAADPNIESKLGGAPLLASAESGCLSVAKVLLAAGANPNVENRYGRTPLFVSSVKYSQEFTDVFLAAKADPNKADKDGMTPLSISTAGSVLLRVLTDEPVGIPLT